jgi:glycosyltransferase involved in cell wall biosynthesis
MSRRMDLLLRAGETLSPGYLTRRLPPLLRRLVMAKTFGRVIVGYERLTLRRIEQRICELADAVVLVSAADAQALAAATPGRSAQIVTIPPPSPQASGRHPFTAPARFVFVGSDALTQNRMTIDYLVELWRRHPIQTPLVLYGQHARALTLPPRVEAAGYAEQIADIYDGRSVLLSPSRLGGGVKTKVLEAFAYGAPVIGNSLTFEALPIGDYPLRVDAEAELVELLLDPMSRRARFERAVAHGLGYIARHHAADAFASRWRTLLAPEPSRARWSRSSRRAARAAALFGREPAAEPLGLTRDAAPPDPAPL